MTEDTGPSDPYQGFSDIESATQSSAPPADDHRFLDPRIFASPRGLSLGETEGPRNNQDIGPAPSAYTEAEGGITAGTGHAGVWGYNAGNPEIDPRLNMMPLNTDQGATPSSVRPMPDLGHTEYEPAEMQWPGGPPAPEHQQDPRAVDVFQIVLGNFQGSSQDAGNAVARFDQAFGHVCFRCLKSFKNKSALR